LRADAGAFAEVFVVGAFIGILKAAQTADIANQDGVEIGVPAFTSLMNCFSGS
jgi:hypothetical protein